MNSMPMSMIGIVFKDGSIVKYKESQYDDYIYDRKTFVVVKKKRWIRIYNLDALSCIEVKGKYLFRLKG